MKQVMTGVLISFLVLGCSGRGQSDGGGIDPASSRVGSDKVKTEEYGPPDEPVQLVDEDLLDTARFVELNPIFFDYNTAQITDEQVPVLESNAQVLRTRPAPRLLIEGHCDERGTEEYNLALGDRRAKVAKEYLVSLGIDGSRMDTISFGENRPFQKGHNETAWSRNRRAQFLAAGHE